MSNTRLLNISDQVMWRAGWLGRQNTGSRQCNEPWWRTPPGLMKPALGCRMCVADWNVALQSYLGAGPCRSQESDRI